MGLAFFINNPKPAKPESEAVEVVIKKIGNSIKIKQTRVKAPQPVKKD